MSSFTVYVKTLAGALLAVEVEEDMPPFEFPFRVYPLLEAPRPPMAFLRFLKANTDKADPEKQEEEEKGGQSSPHSFPLSFEEGDMFYLLVEDPEVTVRFQWRDSAILNKTGEDMEYLAMTVEDRQGIQLMTHAFYVLVVYDYEYDEKTQTHHRIPYYTNVIYTEDQVTIIFNPSRRSREETDRAWRNIVLQPGATAHSSPTILAQRYYRPDWIPYLSDKIQDAWREYLMEMTGQYAPLCVPEQEEQEQQEPEEDYDY